MLAGHIGVALMLGRAERRVNVGVFVIAALLLDVVLWSFVLLGWESVSIPANYSITHQARFVFPYSHGLLAAVLWTALVAGLAFIFYARLARARWSAGALLAAAVFSHWILDALVHQPEMPLVGPASRALGLGLWDDMPVALVVEAGIVVAGVLLFIPGSAWSRCRSASLAALCLVVLALTVLGLTVAPPPPSALAMAASSLATLVAICGLVVWLGRRRRGPA